MANLSQETIRLLDRLFNLKGEENIIIKGIEDEIDTTESNIDSTTKEKNDNEIQRNELQGKLTVFQTQAESFRSIFEGIDDATFASLRDIGIEFEISKMLNTIAEKAPEHIDSLTNQITEYGNEIEKNEKEINELSDTLSRLKEDKIDAEEDRLKLISLLEQSLSNSEIEREVLTVNFVKKVLSLFDKFDDQEIKELTKMIMFPDDGLFEYAKKYEERLANGEIYLDSSENIAEETSEEQEEVEETTPEDEPIAISEEDKEPVENETSHIYTEEQEEIKDIVSEEPTNEITLSSLNEHSEDEEETKEEVITLDTDDKDENDTEDIAIDEEPTTIIPIVELPKEETKVEESIEGFLEEKGLSIKKFADINEAPVSEIMAYLNDVDRNVIVNNYELLRSINADSDDETLYKYANNMLYIADKDLTNKITLLRSKGINDKIITRILKDKNSCFRLNYDNFQDRIKIIEKTQGELSEDNEYLLNCDVELYEHNLSLLNDAGYDLSAEEKRNYCYLLTNSKYTEADIEILKNYLISITRKNGKYALGIFWQKPYNLLTGIDDLIEYNLEDMITSNPEILATNIDNVIRRVKYCEENGIPVYEEGTSQTYYDYILSANKFTNKFGEVELPSLINREDVNMTLSDILANENNAEQVHSIFTNLKDYYKGNNYQIELDREIEEKAKYLSQKLTNSLNAELIGKNTYKLNNIYISKNKLERNISVILSNLKENIDSIESLENEILLIASLYNTRLDENTIRNIVSESLAYSRNSEDGGMK